MFLASGKDEAATTDRGHIQFKPEMIILNEWFYIWLKNEKFYLCSFML